MSNPHPRSAGVTAAATFAILGGVFALYLWGNLFLALLDAPPDAQGKFLYQTHTLAFLLVSIVPSTLIALGVWTGIGLFQLRSWARIAALTLASMALAFCLLIIAFRPFETFFISDKFISPAESLKQLLAIGFILMLLPVSIWWLFFFRSKGVKTQFLAADSNGALQEQSVADKS